eukprot:g5887.t1
MPTADNKLLHEVKRGDARAVDELLRSGQASVDGSDRGRPIVVAASHGRVDIITLLARRGANLNAAVHAPPSSFTYHAPPGANPAALRVPETNGMRALHAAVGAGKSDAVDALLDLGADANCVDDNGLTPLMQSCRLPDAGCRLRIAKQLLRGGGNPALTCRQDAIALTYAASLGDVDLIKLLVGAAPATLNHAQILLGRGITPLGAATTNKRTAAVRALLSLGASDRDTFEREQDSSIFVAAAIRSEAMVKLLLEEGLEAVGGLRAVERVVCEAIQAGDARILHLLISVEGEGRRRRWARKIMGGIPLLHAAAAFDSLAAVVLLLAAGADECLADGQGLRPCDIIGAQVVPSESRDEATEAAIRRALQRGPAFRARSWAWPTLAAVSGGGGDGSERAAAAVPGGVRIYRPKRRLFMSRFNRYSKN